MTEIFNLHQQQRQTRGSKMSDIKPRKMVRRSVAIALGIVCIVLIAGLGGAMVYYTMTINDKNQIVNLTKSTVWVDNQNISQPQDSWTNWTFKAEYAGYVSVQVYYSTILNPSAEVVYSYQGINYDQQKEGTTEAFPIMPSNIEIRVGNGPHVTLYDAKTGLRIILTVNETVTITYYY
jgi:hypothetical protein